MATRGRIVLLLFEVIILSFTSTTSQEVRVTTQKLQSRQIFDYRGYKDVQIFHYRMPDQTISATWNFTARELQDCDIRNVSLYLKHGSYPVVSPDGARFPQDFRAEGAMTMRELLFQSDGGAVQLTVTSPEPGDWFAIAFLHVDSDRIQQKGLAPYCSTWLESQLDISWVNNTILVIPEIQNYHEIQLFQDIEETQTITYKFYVPVDTRLVHVNVTRCALTGDNDRNTEHCPLQLFWSPRALPSDGSPGTQTSNCSDSSVASGCQISFVPWEEEWHYVSINAPDHNVSYALKVIFQSCAGEYPVPRYQLVNDLETKDICSSILKSTKFRVVFQETKPHMREAPKDICWDRVPLLRKTFAGSFMFEYDLHSDENGTTPLKLDISTSKPTIMSFAINPVVDIGGNLNFELGLDPTMNITGYNLSVVACLSYKSRQEPQFQPPRCDETTKTLLQVNTSAFSYHMARVLVPYPEPGMWHVTLKPFCYTRNESNITELIECENITTTIFFSITSGSCVFGSCGAFGRCYQYISGGFIFSTCVCSSGYRGWGCTDDAEAVPGSELLMATLLLTLSNLLFVPSIVLAIYRRYFTEALVYVCTMFFSTFYHACDEEAFSFCLLRLNVMQFCDFYSAILAFWVTLIAMSELPASLTSLLHMAGAIGVALGIEYDRTGLIVFMVPTLSGLAILVSSWIVHCRKRQSCFPTKKYWLICLPPGVILASGGLICYAFFETEDNYKFVHSVWHATMALSIVFFLPFKKVQAVKTKLTWRGLQS